MGLGVETWVAQAVSHLVCHCACSAPQTSASVVESRMMDQHLEYETIMSEILQIGSNNSTNMRVLGQWRRHTMEDPVNRPIDSWSTTKQGRKRLGRRTMAF